MRLNVFSVHAEHREDNGHEVDTIIINQEKKLSKMCKSVYYT